MAENTLGEFLTSAIAARGDANLLAFRAADGWRFLSAAEVGRRVRELAAGLLAYGVEPRGRVALLTESRPEALIADLAVQACGGVSVPIAPEIDVRRLLRVLVETEARQILVSGPGQLARIMEVRPDLPCLDLVLLFDRPEEERVVGSALLETACSLGAGRLAESPDLLEAATRGAVPSASACLIPVGDGALGPAVLALSHENLMQATRALGSALEVGPKDVILSFLPVPRAVHRTFQYLSIRQGALLAFGRSVADLVDLRPTVVVAERDLVESIGRDLDARMRSSSWLRRGVALWALRQGHNRARVALALGRVPSGGDWFFRLADRLSLRGQRRQVTGGRLRFLVSLGRPLPSEVTDALFAYGLPVLEGYDLDVASGLLAVETPGALKRGTVGRPVPGLEVKIGPSGELLARGDMMARPSNRQGFEDVGPDDRWVATGRLARLEKDGWLVPLS